MRQEVRIKTDDNGNFRHVSKLNAPPVPMKNIDLKGELTSPPGVKVDGSIDIDATDGSPSNNPRNFSIAVGQGPYYVGKFTINWGGEEYCINVSGTTSPAQPNTELVCQIEVW